MSLAPALVPLLVALANPSSSSAVELACTCTELEAPVVSLVIRICPLSCVTVHPATAASTMVITSLAVTASMSTTLPVPVAPAAKPSAAAAVPVSAPICEPVPRLSLVMTTAPPAVLAEMPVASALITAATSAAVAVPMAANSAVLNVTV